MIKRTLWLLLFIIMFPFAIVELLIRAAILPVEWFIFGTTKVVDNVYTFNFLLRFKEEYV